MSNNKTVQNSNNEQQSVSQLIEEMTDAEFDALCCDGELLGNVQGGDFYDADSKEPKNDAQKAQLIIRLDNVWNNLTSSQRWGFESTKCHLLYIKWF